MDKMRLDQYLVANDHAPTREKAQAIIMAGVVYINNQKADKSGIFLKVEDVVEVRENTLKYVSRGGYKLEKAINLFDIKLTDKTAMDIGASTGGFTDCMLQNGAEKVFCVDVGYGQLAWSIRNHPNVVNMERTNIRHIDKSAIGSVDFISIDVSFISLKLVLPVAFDLLQNRGKCVALIKPQFEAGKGKVGKGGIVRDVSIHMEVLRDIADYANSINFAATALTFSPIRGARGNIEYLICLQKNGEPAHFDIEKIVQEAHQ